MNKVKILSVSTGRVISKKFQKCRSVAIFKVSSFPYALQISAGATIFFEPDAPEFNLRFDIYDPSGKELDEELHEFEPDFEKIIANDDSITGFEVWLTPKQHIAKSPGMYTLKATIYQEDDVIIDELTTRFLLLKSVEEAL